VNRLLRATSALNSEENGGFQPDLGQTGDPADSVFDGSGALLMWGCQ
jgi:hypothetical protein